jgi:hypothetical protein
MKITLVLLIIFFLTGCDSRTTPFLKNNEIIGYTGIDPTKASDMSISPTYRKDGQFNMECRLGLLDRMRIRWTLMGVEFKEDGSYTPKNYAAVAEDDAVIYTKKAPIFLQDGP